MADASYIQHSFLGGEVSKFFQGRIDVPDYRTQLNVCLNNIPIEVGACVRRPGFQFVCTTRGGNPGRVIKFDFQQQAPYTTEWTDGHLRFLAGNVLATTNDSVGVSSISTTNPTVVTLASAVTWATGDQAYFTGLNDQFPLLQNRVFTLTKNNTTNFSLADAVTGSTIDGSTLGVGGFPSSTKLNRVLDLTTPYSAGTWNNIHLVQTETTAFILHDQTPPYELTVLTQPTLSLFATFDFNPAIFNDGPYLDAFTNGVQATPSAKSGLINLTLSFPIYSVTQAYAKGAFVTFSSVNYESLIDQNVGNQPDTHPADWAAVNAGAAINNGQGFLHSDVGRLVRLFSEPAAWAAGTTYAKGATVSYNPNGLPGQTTYWNALVGANTGNVPGTDLINWQLLAQGGTSSPAIWSWGKITGLLNSIAGATGTAIGGMTGGGGLSAAFNGTLTQAATASAESIQSGGFHSLTPVVISTYIGKNYTGAGGKAIAGVTIYPSADLSFATGTLVYLVGGNFYATTFSSISVTFNLRGKASAPTSASDGTLLGTNTTNSGGTSPISVMSSDEVTVWNYVWVEMIVTGNLPPPIPDITNWSLTAIVSQVAFVAPAGSGTGTGISVELLGPPLLYTDAITNWRLGVYSGTTGWPTCGTYFEGRLWLSGAVANRIDASVANGIVDGTVNWAPTDQYGNVLTSSAISAIFNAPDTNPIFWMIPDLQGIICGTKAGEWLVVAPTAGPIAPDNIAARRVTTIGCANIEPRRTEHTTVFVQKFGRKIMEYFSDVFSGKFTAPHLTHRAKHLTVVGVLEIAYQQELNPCVWARLGDNTLIGCSYKRETLMTSQGPTYAGWHEHSLGSGRDIESITVGASTGGNIDALTTVTNDTTTSIRHVEILTDILDEGSMLTQAAYLDDAITPTSTHNDSAVPAPYGGLTLNGLWALNGKIVTAWIAGLDCGDYTVSNGSITVPYGDGISGGTANGLFTYAYYQANPTAVIGFTYNSDAQLVRPALPAESGARAGPAIGKKRRAHYVVAQLVDTQGISFGTDFSSLFPANFRTDADVPYRINQQFTGVFRDQVSNDYSFDGMMCWRVSRPYICNVAAFGAMLQTQDV